MSLTWLHVSDFHLREGDDYDRDVVLRSLVAAVGDQGNDGRAPDLIVATGDVAHSGKAAEYAAATTFFDALLGAAALGRDRLMVVPGNHDVDRRLGTGLARTLVSREEADAYFDPDLPKPHIAQKLGAFADWYDKYFEGIRSFPRSSTCYPVELFELGGVRLAALAISSALFCQDDQDHGKLWVGRRCLDRTLGDLGAADADLRIALMHHPLDWLSDIERSNVKSSLQTAVDVFLTGHLHETGAETVVSTTSTTVSLAAGAAYQTRRWPNRAMSVTFDGQQLHVFPLRYEDSPTEIWTVDPSIFPREPGFQRSFPVSRQSPGIRRPASQVTAHLKRTQLARRLHEEPSLAYDFFIAHAGQDSDIAERLFEHLSIGSRPFLDVRSLLLGDDWDVELAKAQRGALVTVVLISPNTDSSFYQREEIASAVAFARSNPMSHRVVPVLLPGSDRERMPYGLRLKHRLDVQDANGMKVVANELLKLRARLGSVAGTQAGALGRRLPAISNERINTSRIHLHTLRSFASDGLIDMDISKDMQREIVKELLSYESDQEKAKHDG